MGPEIPGAGRRRAAGAVGGARGGLLRAAFGVTFPRPPAHAGRRAARTKPIAFRSPQCISCAALCLLAGILPGSSSMRLRRSPRLWSAARMPVQARRATGSRSCRSPKAAAPIMGCWSSFHALSGSIAAFAIHRLAPTSCAGRRPGIAAIPTEPGDAIHRRQFRPADPARIRHHRIPRARDRRDAAAGRPRRRGYVELHDRSGMSLYAPIAGAVGSPPNVSIVLQFLTIRRYLSARLRGAGRPALVLAIWH